VLGAGAAVGVALAVLAGTALPGAAGAAISAPKVEVASISAPVTVGADPLGLDVGPWDTLYSNPADVSSMNAYLKAAGISQLHYGGGGSADQYDWQNNTEDNNSKECGPAPTIAAFTSGCETTEPFGFTQFSANARALGAQSFVTVNYGSGTPALAAAWVTQSLQAGQQVAQWDIGNESYGCWEYDTWLTQDPADDTDYASNDDATCPMNIAGQGMATMADSYADNALPYMQQMTEADPGIKIGVPWAFDYHVGGASVADNSTWNDTILGQDGQYISFVEAHWYPFSFGGNMGPANKTPQQVIQSVETIPADYASIESTLSQYDPKATVTVGETGVSYLATNAPCTPTGALFSAGDALEWISSGATNIDWWPMETGSNPGSACDTFDEAMFTGNGTPDTMYTGYLLASQLAKPNAQLSQLSVPDVSNPADTADTFGFQSVLPDGQVVVALFNANTAAAQKVKISTSLAGNLTTETYSAGNQNASNSKVVDGTTTASAIAVAGSINLPAQSLTILKSLAPSKVTLSAAATVKAGAKVTLSGTLTLNGAAAPAGTTVKIYRRIAGSTVNSATLTATTGANGAFTVTDLPSRYDRYNYVASYAGTSLYATASATVPVHVIALQPTLNLKFSAGTVKPGRKVTVTATLSGWHTNRKLVIYAQPKGGAKKAIKSATINAKGQLAVSFTMKVNTTFTVTFGGDLWYGSKTASGIVKT
jgi:hypothetical protein